MAVTIHNTPANYSTSDNPLSYKFSSNQTAQANFSYIVETKLDGVTISTDRVFQEVGIYAHWDASNAIKYLASQPFRPTSLVEEVLFNTVSIKVTESYGTTPSLHSSATSSESKIFKACLSDKEWLEKDFENDYVELKWLTDVPNNEVFITRTQSVYSKIMLDTSYIVTILFYEADGTLNYTYGSSPNSIEIASFNFSPDNLTNTAGVPDLSVISYFQVYTDNSEVMTYRYLDEDCTTPYTLTFINKYGAYDSFVFNHFRELKTSVVSESYKRQFGGWNGSDYEYSLYNSGDTEIIRKMNDSGQLVSGYISKVVQNWLVQLYDSVDTSIQDNGDEYRIKITSSGYTEKTDRFEELINEDLTYSITTRKSIQL